MNSNTASLVIEFLPIDALAAHSSNARTHSKKQIRQIAESIKAFGFNNPVLVDQHCTIIAGHGRVAAARLLGLGKIPIIRLEHLTKDQVRAYLITDNELAAKAGWDKNILAIEFQNLLNIETNFDISVTGFEVAEIDEIIQSVASGKIEETRHEINENIPSVSRHGDCWFLNRHRLFCGSSLHETSYETLMAGRKAAAIFADPPYNVPIQGHVTGQRQHREFAMGTGEMSEAEFVAFLTTFFRLAAQHSADGSLHYMCMDWRHMSELLAAGKQIYSSLLNLCVWAKDNGGMGSFYRSRHELIFVFKNGKAPHRNNVQLGQFGRNRSNVWEYPGARTFGRQGDDGNLSAFHPTVKPVALVADALLDVTARNEIVLDPFLGSGTTLIAAERTGRICYGIEIDPLYIDLAIRRWQKHTGSHAIHAETGKTFDQIVAEVTRG